MSTLYRNARWTVLSLGPLTYDRRPITHGSLIFKTVRKIRPTATLKGTTQRAISPHFGDVLRKRFTPMRNVIGKVGNVSLVMGDFDPKVVLRINFTLEKMSEP